MGQKDADGYNNPTHIRPVLQNCLSRQMYSRSIECKGCLSVQYNAENSAESIQQTVL